MAGGGVPPFIFFLAADSFLKFTYIQWNYSEVKKLRKSKSEIERKRILRTS